MKKQRKNVGRCIPLPPKSKNAFSEKKTKTFRLNTFFPPNNAEPYDIRYGRGAYRRINISLIFRLLAHRLPINGVTQISVQHCGALMVLKIFSYTRSARIISLLVRYKNEK